MPALKDVNVPVPGILDYVMVQDKVECRLELKLKLLTLTQRDYTGFMWVSPE